VLAAALVMSAAAPAAPVLKPRSTVVAKRTNGAAAVDGARYAAWGGGGGRVAVLDERNGSRQLFDLGRKCDSVLPLSGSDAHFLVNCGTTGPQGVEKQQYILDASTGTAEALDQSGYSVLGREWLQGRAEDAFGQYFVYTNWHTGETITEGAARTRVPYDLDSANLDPVGPAATTFVVGGSRALERVGRTIRLVGSDGDQALHKCAHACAPLWVTGGLALWSDGPTTLYGYAIGSRRRYRWRVPEAAAPRGSTGRRIYYLMPLEFDPQFFALKSFRWR
jgi:hypothetical protein